MEFLRPAIECGTLDILQFTRFRQFFQKVWLEVADDGLDLGEPIL